MDIGLYSQNYADYESDATALQMEIEFLDGVERFVDSAFPADSRSLYFDPVNPPKGAFPGDSLEWLSPISGDIIECVEPKVIQSSKNLPFITQGSLGDGYFINAVRLLSCRPSYLRRLLVSNKHASKRCYTWRFFKSGRWRYVHIDDCLPCRPSGSLHFCRNHDPNEISAALVEKAYAKLHGCYEALSYGLIEKALCDLTFASHVNVIRTEHLQPETTCDSVWDIIEGSIINGSLVGCARMLEDAYAENASDRLGITLGFIYQVIDATAVTSEATANLDSLTVGMLCIRVLQSEGGLFLGRWSYGSNLWSDYPSIADQLVDRTNAIQERRGEKYNKQKRRPDETELQLQAMLDMENGNGSREKASVDKRPKGGRKSAVTAGVKNQLSPASQEEDELDALSNDDGKDGDDRDESDTQSSRRRHLRKTASGKVPQPDAPDLFWIQIEDFVEIFNRVYTVSDLELDEEERRSAAAAAEKWQQQQQQQQQQLKNDSKSCEPSTNGVRVDSREVPATANDHILNAPSDGLARDATVSFASNRFISQWIPGDMLSGSAGPPLVKDFPKDSQDDNKKEVLRVNPAFTMNPMYPFAVTEPGRICIVLSQMDRRWSLDRLGALQTDLPHEVLIRRRDRLSVPMKYETGIAFLVVKLQGLQSRVIDFKLSNIVGSSSFIEFSQSCTGSLRLGPGRYAVVPFTHSACSLPVEFVLNCTYKAGALDFEGASEDADELTTIHHVKGLAVNDNDGTRTISAEGAALVEEKTDLPPFNYPEDNSSHETTMDSVTRLNDSAIQAEEAAQSMVPSISIFNDWEFTEEGDELSLISVYDEVRSVGTFVKSLRKEINDLQRAIKGIQ